MPQTVPQETGREIGRQALQRIVPQGLGAPPPQLGMAPTNLLAEQIRAAPLGTPPAVAETAITGLPRAVPEAIEGLRPSMSQQIPERTMAPLLSPAETAASLQRVRPTQGLALARPTQGLVGPPGQSLARASMAPAQGLAARGSPRLGPSPTDVVAAETQRRRREDEGFIGGLGEAERRNIMAGGGGGPGELYRRRMGRRPVGGF